MDQANPPAGNEAETNLTPMSDILGGGNAPQEAASGLGQSEEPQAHEPALTPDPQAAPQANAETPQAPAQAADFDQLANDPKFQEWLNPRLPKWAREHVTNANKTVREAEAQLADARRRQAQPQPQPQQYEGPALDPLADPDGYHRAIQESLRGELQTFQLQTTLTLSERFAKQQHGADAFEDCRAWLSTKPDIEQWAIRQPDPWGAAFTQFQRERVVEEVGDDPAAYRKRLEDQIRAEILAEQQRDPAPANPQMRAQPNQTPPPATAGVRSAAPRSGAPAFTGPTPLGDILNR